MRREKAQAGKRHTRRVCGYGCTLVGRWRRLLTPWQPGGACCTTRTLRPHRHTPSATRPPTGTRPQVPSEGDPDVLLACVDCGAAFSLFSRWRVECEHCHNVFCHDCLSLRHELFDGVSAGSGRTRRRVCSYCFFQLCARHCKARCCADLPIRTLRRFLARKGISTRGAIEKGDLVQSVYSWALDLAAFESEELLASARGSGGGDEMV
mmetsp:Transcript_50821/g.163170  ORF Transcript_50821/g.163170 Transcript_50821/m.163170 type:complete len:208 (+) Transcript_50821:209-832(+)